MTDEQRVKEPAPQTFKEVTADDEPEIFALLNLHRANVEASSSPEAKQAFMDTMRFLLELAKARHATKAATPAPEAAPQTFEERRFRKKPVAIEAVRWTGENRPEVLTFCSDAVWSCSDGITIKTMEGYLHASEGDWIIKGVKGEFYPCKPDIFSATYEAEDAASPLTHAEENTQELLSNPEEVKAVVDGLADVAAGRTQTFEEWWAYMTTGSVMLNNEFFKILAEAAWNAAKSSSPAVGGEGSETPK